MEIENGTKLQWTEFTMIDEFNLSEGTLTNVTKAFAALQIKSMIFDMDMDIETWSLVPKRTDQDEPWLTKWKEKEHGKDFDNRLDAEQE
jgi:hypothetical protein